jgi:hypothetical protein
MVESLDAAFNFTQTYCFFQTAVKPRICSSHLLWLDRSMTLRQSRESWMVNNKIKLRRAESFQILAATLVYCFETPVLLTGLQRETIGTFVPLLFHPPDETKLPVARVVVCDTISLLNIFINMPSSQNHSNCAFRCGFLHLATAPTAKSGLNGEDFFWRGKHLRKPVFVS